MCRQDFKHDKSIKLKSSSGLNWNEAAILPPHSNIAGPQHQMIDASEHQIKSDDIFSREERKDRIQDHIKSQYQPQDIYYKRKIIVSRS